MVSALPLALIHPPSESCYSRKFVKETKHRVYSKKKAPLSERQIAALTQFKEELDGLYERARKQPAPEPQQGGYCHIIETGTAEIKAGTSQVSDFSHREA